MKEATGELSMTVITIIAIVLIAGIVAWLGPKVGEYIEGQWNTISNPIDDGIKGNNG